jgi:hypothetical protein
MTMPKTDERADGQDGVVVPLRRSSNGPGDWEPWVAEQAVARHYDVSTRTIRRWRAAGMPSQVFGGVRRYRFSECELWHRQQGAA